MEETGPQNMQVATLQEADASAEQHHTSSVWGNPSSLCAHSHVSASVASTTCSSHIGSPVSKRTARMPVLRLSYMVNFPPATVMGPGNLANEPTVVVAPSGDCGGRFSCASSAAVWMRESSALRTACIAASAKLLATTHDTAVH
eukprot:617720-Pleurochrysis_carterae.AAC.1